MAKLFREDTPIRIFSRQNAFLFLGGLLVLGALGAAGYFGFSWLKNFQDTAFVIEGTSYSRDDVRKLIEYPVSRGASEEDAAKTAFEYYKRQWVAQKLQIHLTDEEVATARKAVFGDLDVDNDWIELSSKDTALTTRLALAQSYTTAKGYYFIFPFSNHMVIGEDIVAGAPANAGDPAAIAADRAYADGRAKYYQTQLKEGKITPEQALKEVKADTKLDYLNSPGSNGSMRFEGLGNTQAGGLQSYLDEEQKTYLTGISDAKGVGEIKTGSITKGENGEKIEASFYFGLIDEPAASQDGSSFNEELKNVKSEYRGL